MGIICVCARGCRAWAGGGIAGGGSGHLFLGKDAAPVSARRMCVMGWRRGIAIARDDAGRAAATTTATTQLHGGRGCRRCVRARALRGKARSTAGRRTRRRLLTLLGESLPFALSCHGCQPSPWTRACCSPARGRCLGRARRDCCIADSPPYAPVTSPRRRTCSTAHPTGTRRRVLQRIVWARFGYE